MDKCFDRNCTSDFCIPRFFYKPNGEDLPPQGQPLSFRTALDYILQEKTNVAGIDSHWALQSNKCGLNSGSLEKYFTIIGRMTKETLSNDGNCIMDAANISQYNIPASVKQENNMTPATFWSPGGGVSITYRREKEEDVLKKLFTKEAALELMEKYRQDYEIFQLPVPEWIESATGEWMDSLDHHSCIPIPIKAKAKKVK